MKLTFIGSGSAFTVGANNFHSNILIEASPSSRLLIDCGSDIRWSLDALGYSHTDISDVYISHLHGDHAGGLEWLAFKTKFDPSIKQKPILHIAETLVDRLWEHVLSGGLQSLETESATLSTYFNVQSIGPQLSFEWNQIHFTLVPTDHVFNGNQWIPSYGLFFTLGSEKIFFTADMQFKPEKYQPYYDQATLIFHECETAAFPSGVHCSYQQLLTLDSALKKKIWLYHYNPGQLPDAKQAGFLGFVQRGQVFKF